MLMVMRRLWEMRKKAPGISALEAPRSVLVSSSTLFPVIIIIMYFWLHWVFVAAHGLSLAVGFHCGGFFRCRAQALDVRAQYLPRLSCSMACGISPTRD